MHLFRVTEHLSIKSQGTRIRIRQDIIENQLGAKSRFSEQGRKLLILIHLEVLFIPRFNNKYYKIIKNIYSTRGILFSLHFDNNYWPFGIYFCSSVFVEVADRLTHAGVSTHSIPLLGKMENHIQCQCSCSKLTKTSHRQHEGHCDT